MNKTKTVAVFAVIAFCLAVGHYVNPVTVHAQNAPSFTVTSLGATGIVLVGASTGKITFCNYLSDLTGSPGNYSSARPTGGCLLLGNLPLPTTNWSIPK